MCSVSAERCQPESHHSSWCSVALVSPSLFSEGAANKGGVCVCVSVRQMGGQQGPRCDREGGTGPLGAVTAGRQGDFLPAVQWNGEDVAAQNRCLVGSLWNRHNESVLHHWQLTWLLSHSPTTSNCAVIVPLWRCNFKVYYMLHTFTLFGNLK